METPWCMYVCLFVWGFSSNSRIFHSQGDVTNSGDGLQMLTYARHLRPSSRKGSLAKHTYCDTGHPLIMVISEDPWHSHLLPSCHFMFYDLGLSRLGFEHPNFRVRDKRSYRLHYSSGLGYLALYMETSWLSWTLLIISVQNKFVILV